MLHHHQAGLAFSSQRKQSQTLSGEFGKRSVKDFPGLFCQSLASSFLLILCATAANAVLGSAKT